MNLPPDSADETRRRVNEKHRLGRAVRLAALEIESRELKRELRRIAVRISMLDGAINVMREELRDPRGDETTIRVQTLPPMQRNPNKGS